MRSNKISCLIADDERLVRERIAILLEAYPDFELQAIAEDGREAIEALKQQPIQVLFLDIRMPKADGFRVLEHIDVASLLIVFITAYDEYALKAFDYAAFDYLLKPIRKERFQQTIGRIRNRLAQGKAQQYLMIKHKGRHKKIALDEILFLEAADNYVKVYGKKGVFQQRITLQKLVSELEPAGFLRVHRSYAINAQHVQDLVHVYQGDYLIRLISGKVIPSSKSYRNNVRKLLS